MFKVAEGHGQRALMTRQSDQNLVGDPDLAKGRDEIAPAVLKDFCQLNGGKDLPLRDGCRLNLCLPKTL